MRVVVFGATGNAGTSFIDAAQHDPSIESIVGVARRLPDVPMAKTEWVQADISKDDLGPLVHGADCVVHLAWLIQPSRDLPTLYATNVDGSRRVFQAVVDNKVPSLVYASSVGAYSLGPKDRLVDESWPTDGVQTSFYSRHKAETESMLDVLGAENPSLRIVRLRPGLIFKRGSATGQRRLFAGPFVPRRLVRTAMIPIVPDIDRLRFQCVHSRDIGEAYRLAVTSDVEGAFNIAADPPLGPSELSELLGARPIKMKAGMLYRLWDATYKMHLHPTPAGWLDLALQTPLMDTTRARDVLGWVPSKSSGEALIELIEGMHDGSGLPTPPLSPDRPDRRLRELLGGVGERTSL